MKKARKPKQAVKPQEKHGKLEFSFHVLTTTLDIAVLTAAAVALHHVVAWGEGQGLPWFIIYSLKTLEYSAYAIDVLLSGKAIIKMAIKGFTE